jgi:diguanylate cyclase (GGDEF)-like protein
VFKLRPLTKERATLAAAAAAAATFAFDLSQPLGVAGGMPYVVLPLLGLLARSARIVIVAAVLGTLLTFGGMALSAPGSEFGIALVNRLMSVALIWIAAFAAIQHLSIGQRLGDQLRKQALTDPLTGLYNRRHVFACIDRELKRFNRYEIVFSVILIDADHFKQVNDNYGHGTGDATLRLISNVCMASVRETDIVGRFGGEEFIVLLPHTRVTEARVVAERIRHDLAVLSREQLDGAVLVTLSLGVAEVAPEIASFDALLAAADKALYAAKREGRDRVVVRAGASLNLSSVDAA